MTNGPDDQPEQELPPPSAPPPPSGGRGLFARNDPDQPGPTPPPERERPPRQDPRVRQPQAPQAGPDDNPFLLPNERDRTPVYGAAPPVPVIPLALMVLAIAVGAALFYMSRSDKESGGISPQQAASGLVLHLDNVDITEDAFRREISKGVSNGRVPCNVLAPQAADNIAAGLKIGALKMEVPNKSGVAAKANQKADDASLLVAAKIVLEICPKAAPGQGNTQPPANPPGGQVVPNATPGANPPGGQVVPGAATVPAGQPIPGGTVAPAGTPRPIPTTGAAPAATPRR